MATTLTIPNVPDQAIEIMLRELRRHGANVNRPHVGYGEVTSDVGVMRFWHSIAKVLTVQVEYKGPVPGFMIEMGVRRQVAAAIEAAGRGEVA